MPKEKDYTISIDPQTNMVLEGTDVNIIWQPDSLVGEPMKYGRQWEFLTAPEDIVAMTGGKGSGKKLWVETPIATSTGWTTMGEIKVGDRIFDDGGNVCDVVYVSPISYGDSYKAIFSDRSFIFADSGHLWSVETQESRDCGREPKVLSTHQIFEQYEIGKQRKQPWKFSILNAMPLNLPSIDLPVQPYFLGLWLGDGNARSPIITMEKGDGEFIGAELERMKIKFTKLTNKNQNIVQFYALDLKDKLKKLNVLLNKHIPPIYLRSSQEQRLELLQGLLDSDGCGTLGGQAEFYNASEKIIFGVEELIASLGMNCRVRSKKGKLNGKEYKTAYTVNFTPTMPVFRLPRKLARIFLHNSRNGKRRIRRYITDIIGVESMPMRCIAIDSPSHLYLAGREMIPTHNSDCLIFDTLRPEKINNPHFHAVIFRREYKRLTEVLDRAHFWISRMPYLKSHWQGDKSRFIFPSGAWLAFHNCELEGDEKKYQGWQITDLKFDQIEEFLESQYNFLVQQNRSGDPKHLHSTVKMTANPVGVGRDWVKRRFIDGRESNKPYTLVVDVNGQQYVKTFRHIFATVFDNPVLGRDKKYIATLASEPNPYLRKALFEGSWDVVVGMFFHEFTAAVHVLPSRELDPKYRRLAGLDYGNVKAMEFLARDYAGNIYAEWECCSKPNEMNPAGDTATQFGEKTAEFMLKRGLGEGLRVVGDTNMWSATGRDLGTDKTPAMVIQAIWMKKFKDANKRLWPILVPASKRATEEYRYRIACNEAIRDFLHYESDQSGKIIREPKVFFLERCNELITCLSNLVTDPSDPMDIDDAQPDHEYDAFKMPFLELQAAYQEKVEEKPKTEAEWLDKTVFQKAYDRLLNPKKSWAQR